MKTENIPSELRALSQWVNWKVETKNGKPTKIPLNPKTLGNAMSNNSDTWGSFERALTNCNNDRGIGFVCTKDDPYTGIDLDKCRNPFTGKIEPWALEIIKKVSSYSEVSPSDTGIRIFVKCKLPEGTRKVGRVEAYDCNHFLTLTGNILDGITEIRTIDGAELHRFLMRVGKDQQIIDKAKSAKNGEKFQALWNGDWSGYSSQSEADMALVSLLYFYTKDREWTEKLFRKSGLMRAKWDVRHFSNGTTYGQKLIEEVSRSDKNSGAGYPHSIGSENKELWNDPIPFDDYSELPNFPVDTLFGIGREIVLTVSEINQIDPGLTASAYLSVLSACLSKKGIVTLQTHEEPLNLYTCSILDSGERKSSTMAIMTKPLYEYQAMKQKEIETEISETLNAHKIRELRLAKLQKQAAQMEDPIERQRFKIEAAELLKKIHENPISKLPVSIADDITSEALGILIAENKERMSIFSTEGGIFGILAGRYNEQGCNLDLFLKSHSNDPCSFHRVGREAKTMQSPCLTVCLTVQPDVINEIGKNKQFRGRGLLARFLYSCCKSQAGYRDRQIKVVPDSLLRQYRGHVFNLLDIPLITQILKLSPEAQALWGEFYNDIEHEMRQGNSLEHLKDWGSKLPGAVARIAGLLHFAEHGNNAPHEPICVNIVNASAVIGAYYKDHALATFGIMTENPRIESAKKILNYLTRYNPEFFKGRDVLRHTNLKTMDEVIPGLKVLIERDYIREMETEHSGVGRPEALSYYVNPKLKNVKKTTDNIDKTKAAYRIYSEILESYLWVVDTNQDMHSLRSQGVSEAIYTADEITKLKGLDKDSLKGIHKVKEVFENSKIEEKENH